LASYFEVLKGVFSKRARLILIVGFACAATLTALGTAEDAYVAQSFNREERSRLQETISKVTGALITRGRLDLPAYRQATDLGPADVIVLTRHNEVIDAEGDDVAAIFSGAAIPLFRHSFVTSEMGEKWYVLSRDYPEGRALVGTNVDPGTQSSDYEQIATDVKAFGKTFSKAISVKARDFSNTTSGYIVVDALAHVKAVMGGIPVRAELQLPPKITDGELVQQHLPGGRYSVLATHLVPFGLLIVALDDTSDQANIAASYRLFNIVAAAVAWIILVTLALSLLLRYEVLLRRQELPLEDALKSGETQFVEFKEGFNEPAIARSIVAFSNTNHGNVFVGVSDKFNVVGIGEVDPKEQDLLLQRLRNITAQRIRPPVFVRAKFLSYGDKTVLRIFVPRGIEPFYTYENIAYIRNLTSVMKAEPAQLMELIKRSRSAFSA
jgi:hypothetical protein